MPTRHRILDLFSGVGAVHYAARCLSNLDCAVVAAVDINEKAAETSRLNGLENFKVANVETLSDAFFTGVNADIWWASPPCQPYTSRGRQRDWNDPRAASLITLIDRLTKLLPPSFAMENVPGFFSSETRRMLLRALRRSGYVFDERILCPTAMGIPSCRKRYYLVARRGQDRPEIAKHLPKKSTQRSLADFLCVHSDETELDVPQEWLSRYASAIHCVDPHSVEATRCFTSAYGRSPVGCGSYLKQGETIRFFAPTEIASLLGFPQCFHWPPGLRTTNAWRLLGNSLSIPVVKCILRAAVS